MAVLTNTQWNLEIVDFRICHSATKCPIKIILPLAFTVEIHAKIKTLSALSVHYAQVTPLIRDKLLRKFTAECIFNKISIAFNETDTG